MITSIEQEYKSTEGQQDYRTALGVIYRGGVPMDIVNAKDNFKNKKSKYFNWNVYKYITKDCKKPKKEWKTRECYKCKKIGYIAKNYQSEQKIKNRSVQEDTDRKQQ